MYKTVLLLVCLTISFCLTFAQDEHPYSSEGVSLPKHSLFRSRASSQLTQRGHHLKIGDRDIPFQTMDGAILTEHELATMKDVLTDDFLVNDDTSGGVTSQYYPSVAMNRSGNFVAVWEDYCNGYNNPDIYCQRFNSSGTAQGAKFKVNDYAGVGYQSFPSVAVDVNGNFVVAWGDYRNGNGDIYCQRYNSSGTAQGVNFKVNDDAGTAWQEYPSIVVDGSGNFVIVWYDHRNSNGNIYCQRYNSSGDAQGVNFKIDDDAGSIWPASPAIAVNGCGNFVVAWEDHRNWNHSIYCQRYTFVGMALGGNFKVSDDTETVWREQPSIAEDDGGNFIVAWGDYRNGNEDIYCQQYNSSGIAQGVNFKVNDDAGTADQGSATIAVDGNGNFIVAWGDYRNSNGDIYCQRYNSLGAAQGANNKVNDDAGTASQEYPSIAIDVSGNFVIVWEDYRNGNGDIYCQRYNFLGVTQGGNFKVNDDAGTAWQKYPSIAIDVSGNFAIVWEDYRNGNGDIYCQRYSSLGAAQGVNNKVNDDAGTSDQFFPSIAVDGNGNFVIVWGDYRNGNYSIYCQRYNFEGVAQGGNFRVKNDSGTACEEGLPSIAADNSGNFVIAWCDCRNGNYDVYCQRYDSSGVAESGNFKVNDDTGASVQAEPTIIIYGNGNFVVAWTDGRNGNFDIYCQKYDSSGIAQGVNIKVNDDLGAADQVTPSIGVDRSGNFEIAWHDYRNKNWEIYCQRYDSSGSAQGVNVKVNDDTGIASKGYPHLAVDESGNFVVVWEDYRYGLNNPDVVGQRYRANGSPLGTNYRIVTDGPNHGEMAPAVAANGNTIVFAWMDNRRSKGWDIYGKIVGWDWEGVTSVISHKDLPTEFALQQNYPNPFNPNTFFNFQLPTASFVTLKVFDVLGREVATLVNEKKEPGKYEINWNANKMTSGIYIYQLTAGIQTITRKAVLLK